MNEERNRRKKVTWSKAKRPTLIQEMIIPCLVVLIIMLVLITALQHNLIGEYQEAVSLLSDRAEHQVVIIEGLQTENKVLRESVSFTSQTLEEIDLLYIQTIPEGVDLRIQLALQALGAE